MDLMNLAGMTLVEFAVNLFIQNTNSHFFLFQEEKVGLFVFQKRKVLLDYFGKYKH